MEIYVNINGVLRNYIQKFEYHYTEEYIEKESEEGDTFEYGITYPIDNDDILKSFKFNSKDEFENFTFIEYALEIFGHSGLSYSTTITDFNKIMYEYPEHNFTIVGIDEFGKSIPASLFFMSKNGLMCKNIKFIKSKDIDDEWKNCDLWITDSEHVVNKCPKDKKYLIFETKYNEEKFMDNEFKITDLKQIENYVKDEN